jgi:hypothetical protein
MRKLLLTTILIAFLVGGLSERHALAPWPQLFSLKQRVFGSPPVESRYLFDEKDRLISDERKTQVDCPVQTDRTAVLLVLGQSNAANYGGQRFVSQDNASVVNFFEGKCFVSESPLLGSTGTKGEYWTRLGNLLVSSGQFDQVVVAPLAFSGSEVARWARGGDLNAMLVETLTHLHAAGYRVTQTLWDQGEIDYVKGTSEQTYVKDLTSMIETLRQLKMDAIVYVSVASKCLEASNGGLKTHNPENAIVRAQTAVARNVKGVKPGANTDRLLDDLDRYDDCHIGGSGAEKVAQAWAELLLSDSSRRAQAR